MRELRPGLIAVALFAAGCFSDRGAAIQVDLGGTGAQVVSLFVSTTTCAKGEIKGIDCDGIGPIGFNKLPGDVFYSDTLEPTTQMVTGNVATFRLESETTKSLPAVVIVGTTTDGHVVGVAKLSFDVPAHDARIYDVTLTSAGDMTTNASTAAGAAALIWSAPANSDQMDTCVVARINGDNTFIGPMSDPDCDGILAQDECVADVYLGSKPEDSTPCLGTDQGVCFAGTHGCLDANKMPNDMTTCVPGAERVCVPDFVCAASMCMNFEDCVNKSAGNLPAGASLIRCTVSTGPGCGQVSQSLTVPGNFPNGCGNIDPMFGSLNPTDPQHGQIDSDFTFNGVVFHIKQTDGKSNGMCTLQITKDVVTGTAIGTDVGYVELQASAKADIDVPILFMFDPDPCDPGGGLTCSMPTPSDHAWTCAGGN